MKKTMRLAVLGALLAAGISQASAQSNVWDQLVTFTLNGWTQAGFVAANTRSLIDLMSNQTNIDNTAGVVTTVTNTVVSTNITAAGTNVAEVDVTNDFALWLSVSNSWFATNLVSGTNLVFTNFPTSIVATNFVVLSNGVPVATNSVTLSSTTLAPPTYTFANLVASNEYYFTNIFAITNSTLTNSAAPFITAVLLTNSTTNSLVFSLEYSTQTFATNTVVVTTTNGITNVTPNFSSLKSPSLHRLVTIIDGTNSPAKYVVRTLRPLLDTDVTGFFSSATDTNTVSISKGAKTIVHRLKSDLFSDPDGSFIKFVGDDVAVFGPLRSRGTELTSSILLGSTNVVGFAGSVPLGILDGRGSIIVYPGVLNK
jgi:hypothetical protein